MSFEITIKESREVKTLTSREWKQASVGHGEEGTQFAYTPQVEQIVQEQVVILNQTVETLDLKAVIKAINGI